MAQPLDNTINNWEIDWNIDPSDDDFKATKARYSKECPALLDPDPQTAMFKVLTAGQKMNKPLLLYLCDSYTRCRIKQYKKDKTLLSFQHWVETDQKIQMLTNKMPQRQNILKSAIATFYKRFNCPIYFDSLETINDSIKPFALYVDEALYFIKQLLNKKMSNATPPFQIDIWIIPKAIKTDDDDTDDEEGYDDIDGDNDSKEQKIESDEYDIEKSLENVPHITHIRKPTARIRRAFLEKYKEFIQSDAIKASKDYPRNKRFCIIADRRDKKQDDIIGDDSQGGDTLYFYQPLKGNNIPNDHLHEQYIQNSAECVLPESDNCKEVTAKSGSTKLFLLSFHVEAEDEIKCYLYHKNMISRFYPQDILDVWPCFFVKNESNDEFVKKQLDPQNTAGVDQFIKELEITDAVFDNSPLSTE